MLEFSFFPEIFLYSDYKPSLLLHLLTKCMHLGEEQNLSWDERLQIAFDISHGIEYLHEGVCSQLYFLLFNNAFG